MSLDMVADGDPLNILFIQNKPCSRNRKAAIALRKLGHRVTLGYTIRNNYEGIYDEVVEINDKKTLIELCSKYDLVHTHNEPDIIAALVIEYCPDTILIHDCHDSIELRNRDNPYLSVVSGHASRHSTGRVYCSPQQMIAAKQLYDIDLSRTIVLMNTVTESDVPSVTNTATAHGSDPLGRSITDKDPCTINTDILPGILITKTASLDGSCPGSDPLTVHIGDNVTYCFNVSNTGDVSLTNVSVTDNRYGVVTLGTKTLSPGESTTGTIRHTVTESDVPSVTNTATAHGCDPLGRIITDIDSCTINVKAAPEVQIVKTASLTGVCPGSDPLTVHIGDNVPYCYNITNTGDITLINITVNDDHYGPVNLSSTFLAPSQSS